MKQRWQTEETLCTAIQPEGFSIYKLDWISFNLLIIFLILNNLRFYMNEPLKGTDCLQKSLDGIFILPDKV